MKKSLFIILSVMYLVIAIWLLFFFPFTHPSRLDTSAPRSVNPVPFRTTLQYLYNAWEYQGRGYMKELLLNVGGNILLFVPMGIIIFNTTIPAKRKWIPLILGFLLSLSVETIQLLTWVGNFDVDDIFLNTAGATLGAYMASGMRMLQVP